MTDKSQTMLLQPPLKHVCELFHLFVTIVIEFGLILFNFNPFRESPLWSEFGYYLDFLIFTPVFIFVASMINLWTLVTNDCLNFLRSTLFT